MRTGRYAAVAAVTTMISGWLVLGPAPAPAYACDCAQLTEQQYAAEADLVVQAVVTGVRQPLLASLRSTDHPVRVRVVVEEVHKGSADEQLTLTTARDEASCGFTFREGHRYLVHARQGHTGLCAGNQHLSAAPEVPLDSRWPPAAVTAAVSVFAGATAVGWWVMRRRGRSA
jgi:hypothetical protein